MVAFSSAMVEGTVPLPPWCIGCERSPGSVHGESSEGGDPHLLRGEASPGEAVLDGSVGRFGKSREAAVLARVVVAHPDPRRVG